MRTFVQWLNEDNQRTGAKIGLYPPLYTLSQYPDSYYTPIAADFVTYWDIERKKPSKQTGITLGKEISPKSKNLP